jgi:hypothetical protein
MNEVRRRMRRMVGLFAVDLPRPGGLCSVPSDHSVLAYLVQGGTLEIAERDPRRCLLELPRVRLDGCADGSSTCSWFSRGPSPILRTPFCARPVESFLAVDGVARSKIARYFTSHRAVSGRRPLLSSA